MIKVVDGRLISTHPTNVDKEVKAYGVNYFDIFNVLLKFDNFNSYEAGFAELSSYNIAFVRFPLGFWPDECDLYVRDKTLFFSKLTAIFDSAEAYGIGVIPTFFWNRGTVPDIVGESVNQLGNPDSLTCQYIRELTSDFFVALGDHKALWAVEFANEMNLVTDLPNSDIFRPSVQVTRGTPAFRTSADELTLKDYLTSLEVFSREVRKHNSTIPITSGNSLLRGSAYNNARYNSWASDSISQMTVFAKLMEGDFVDFSSVHLYESFKNQFTGTDIKTYSGILDVLSNSTTQQGSAKAMFIGEFGVPRTFGTDIEVREEFERLLSAISASNTSLVCLWVYNYAAQDADWNVTGTNSRSYQLTKLQELNSDLSTRNELALF